MRFPSVKLLAQNTSDVLKRFPVEIAFALMGTVAATISIRLTKNDYGVDTSLYTRLIMSANLGLLLNLAVSLFTQSRQTKAGLKWTMHLGACAVIALLFFILNPYDNGTADFIRFALVSLGFHLLVSFAAFIGRSDIHLFWQFNKTLFLRILASALYGVVLFLGLAAALGSMNFLFNSDFRYDTFLTLWAWISGVFVTFFFLAGVPADLSATAEEELYPKGLKIFTQYVLIPLATVYVVILLSYEVKILVQWRLPKGMVSDMILGYAVFGILSLLLLHPIRNLEENKWLKTFARSFYFLMIPLVVLLFVAVGARIFKYGITEYRYFLILLSVWLCAITGYFLTSKKQNIKIIPVSLCVLSLLSVYGPQSAFSVSAYSQRLCLERIFKSYDAYKNGKLLSLKDKKVSKRDGSRTVAIVDYLVNDHDFNQMQPYFTQDLKHVTDSLSKERDDSGKVTRVTKYRLASNKVDWVKDQLGISRFRWNRYGNFEEDVVEDKTIYYYLNADRDKVTDIKGFDYEIGIRFYGQTNSTTHKVLGRITQVVNDDAGNCTLNINGEKLEFDIALLEKQLVINKDKAKYKNHDGDYAETYDMPQKMLELSASSISYDVVLRLSSLQFQAVVKSGTVKPMQMNGTYYIKIKP